MGIAVLHPSYICWGRKQQSLTRQPMPDQAWEMLGGKLSGAVDPLEHSFFQLIHFGFPLAHCSGADSCVARTGLLDIFRMIVPMKTVMMFLMIIHYSPPYNH